MSGGAVVTASLPLPGLPTLEVPSPPRATPARRADLAALRVGDPVTVYDADGRMVRVERVTRDGSAEKARSLTTLSKWDASTTWSLRDGVSIVGHSHGYTIRPYVHRDEERIAAWEDVARAAVMDRAALEYVGAAERKLARLRGEVETIEAALPAARHEARIAAAALSDARARLARIDEEGGT